jgi:hypothetical protein
MYRIVSKWKGRNLHKQYLSCIEHSHPIKYQIYYVEHKIGAVISAAKGKNLAHSIPKHIEYLYIPAIDHESFDISQFFDTSY